MFKNAPMFKRVKAQAKGKNLPAMRQKDIQARSNILVSSFILTFYLEQLTNFTKPKQQGAK